MSDISKRFKQLPEILSRKSISELGREIGYSPQAMNRIASGKSKPSFDLLVKLIETFHLNPYWLLLGEGEPVVGQSQVYEPDVSYRGEGSASSYQKMLEGLKALQRRVEDLEEKQEGDG